MNPNDAVVIGDAKDPKILEARKKVEALQAQAEEALAKLEKDPQADLAYMIQDFGIGELRLATNAINDIMDDKTAAATQRWQRLMIQAKYQWEIDVPFPTTKKGEERPRGEKRNDRIKESLKKYLTASKDEDDRRRPKTDRYRVERCRAGSGRPVPGRCRLRRTFGVGCR
ncbi:Hypothetical protein (Fragment) [Durusdinium trenchii]|uniref:Uncharacterized protein n=1 Tax=Durusdinium trenchii TaxID=1381693 RepID=A0ABP0SK25_9DINO